MRNLRKDMEQNNNLNYYLHCIWRKTCGVKVVLFAY